MRRIRRRGTHAVNVTDGTQATLRLILVGGHFAVSLVLVVLTVLVYQQTQYLVSKEPIQSHSGTFIASAWTATGWPCMMSTS